MTGFPDPTWLVGCGNMAGAMVEGWRAAGLDLGDVVAIRPSGTLVEGVRTVTELPQAPAPGLVMLGFKPQKLDEVAPALDAKLGPATILISLLAGIEAASLRERVPKVRAIVHALPYFVALPTTSGTGSEVGRSSVVSENDSHLKRVVFSPKILAKTVFADPELTFGLPAHVTAATGMDALTHNVESYLSPAYHPLCDGIALAGTRIAAGALLTAVREPHNLQARSDMMMSSMMGAIAFQKDLGAVHSCAHALGAVCDLHHGLANALMIDTVLAWNYEAVPGKFDELAHIAGTTHAPPRTGCPDPARFGVDRKPGQQHIALCLRSQYNEQDFDEHRERHHRHDHKIAWPQ